MAPSGQAVCETPAQPTNGKPILGAVFQWCFLILLGSALSLTAAKGAWDVFALLIVAASMQLGGQVAKWLGSANGGSSSGSRRGVGRAARGYRGPGPGPGDAAAAAALRAPPRVAVPDPRLGGAWVKDASRSDPMDEAVAAMRLNGIVRTAIRLVRGVEVDPTGLRAGRFDMAVTSVIAWFKVRESYLLDGTVGYFNRRDLRKGKHAASVAVQQDGSILVSISWGEPLGGSGTDHFALVPAAAAAAGTAGSATAVSELAATAGSVSEPAAADDGDLLIVTSTLRLGGPSRPAEGQQQEGGGGAGPAPSPPVVYRTVYVRAGRGRRHRPQHQQQHQQQQQLHHQHQSGLPPGPPLAPAPPPGSS